MRKRSLQQLMTVSALTAATVLALSMPAHLKGQNGNGQGQNGNNQGQNNNQQGGNGNHQDDDDDRPSGVQLATGQFITPTALTGAVQQLLNPNLSAYPNFIAGEAVRSR